MIKLLDEETQKMILANYPEKYHELLLKQILALEDTINQNLKYYQEDKGYRKAMQQMISDIVQGKYLGINPMEF